MNYDQKRKQLIEEGEEFQDFVVDCCWNKLGLAVVQYTSKKYQFTVGESRSGIEIKNDRKFRESNQLWIEVAEKSHPDVADYSPAGILRKDNTWLYIIGDEKTLFVFAKSFLRALHHAGKYEVLQIPTSRGMMLPLEHAHKYAAVVVYPDREN